MDIVETKPTFHTMHSADGFLNLPNDDTLIQKLPILMNIKKEIFDIEHDYDNLINPLESSNYQAHNLVNIKTDPDGIQFVQYNNTEIFSESPLSKISDAKDSTELDLNLLSTAFIKNDIKFSSDEALIKKEIFDTEHKYDNLINPLELVNIKTDPDSTRSMQCNNTEIFSKTPLSKKCDEKESIKLNFNSLSTQIIKHESTSTEVETHGTESTSLTTDLETSLISIKDENFGKLEDFEDAFCDENLAESRDTFYHICKICNKKFLHKGNLKYHEQRVHLKIKYAKCTHCDKSFKHMGHLKNHEKAVHLKIRDWKCNLCDKYFTEKCNLKRHEETIHLKVKNVKCSHCNKSFTQMSSLKNHVKTVHLKIRDWKCDLCDKYFTEKGSLKLHEKTVHLKIRDWKCNLCDKYFAVKSHLKRHEETVHLRIKNWKCNICEKTFAKKVNLDSHSRVHSIDLS